MLHNISWEVIFLVKLELHKGVFFGACFDVHPPMQLRGVFAIYALHLFGPCGLFTPGVHFDKVALLVLADKLLSPLAVLGDVHRMQVNGHIWRDLLRLDVGGPCCIRLSSDAQSLLQKINAAVRRRRPLDAPWLN